MVSWVTFGSIICQLSYHIHEQDETATAKMKINFILTLIILMDLLLCIASQVRIVTLYTNVSIEIMF